MMTPVLHSCWKETGSLSLYLGTVPPSIHVLVMLTFHEAPKALGTRRPCGHLYPHKDPKGVSEEDAPLTSLLFLSGPYTVALSRSIRHSGPRMPHTQKTKLKFGNPLLSFPWVGSQLGRPAVGG